MSTSFHIFDDTSVLNPVTGKTYGPGPLWAGTEPMDYPDPRCVCGGLWLEDGCILRRTFFGASWDLGQATRALGRAVTDAILTPLHRLYAHRLGYFWLPCPLCGQHFGGHQWKTSDELPGEIRDPDSGPYSPYLAICPRCRKAGKGHQ